ncbi:MAG TPA: D-2-hydroxyacid dehydrogenase [Alphaproteobacteria bacterium]|nr:D-2-hydroxyacid dehydrogenase [Alphaproteobacteria bacterium]
MKMLFYPARYGRLIDRLAESFPTVEMIRIHQPEDIAANLPGVEAMVSANSVFSSDVGRAVREHGKALRWMQFTTSGIDTALKGGVPDGIPVTNGGGMHAHTVAAHAFSLLLALMRRLNECGTARAAHQWLARNELGPTLVTTRGRTMALIGLGSIGQDIARKAKAFDMRVLAVSRGGGAPNVDKVYPRERMHEALSEADVIVAATSYDASSHHMIDAAALAAAKPGAIFVNIARGSVVDETALIAALRSGQIGAAGLDVTEVEPLPPSSPLWDMPNVVLTPHVAGSGADNNDALYDVISVNLRRFLAGQKFERVVHGPNPGA